MYVFAEKTYLRDRVAIVANRVAEVTNGERLEIVERERRFLQVKTPAGQIGWIEDHQVITQEAYDQFLALKQEHAHDPIVATGVLRDAFYLHLKPGRETERFYLAPENDKLELLQRASIPRTFPGGAIPAPSKPMPRPTKALAKTKAPERRRRSAKSAAEPMGLPQIPMQDWWLVRDAQGQVGWLEQRRFDIDVPDAIGGYSEGQRMVGAYVLTEVDDPDSNAPNHQVPVYLALLNSYKEGLPYDFNQIRVFTWNIKKHRYETGYRQRELEGYLPVKITHEKVDGPVPLPVFAIRVAVDNSAATDPVTGAPLPVQTEILRYALEGQMVRRLLPPGASPVAATPAHAHAPRVRRRPARTRRHRHHHRGAESGG